MIEIRDIGISLTAGEKALTFSELEHSLEKLKQAGYALVEVNPNSLALIIDGEVRQKPVAHLLSAAKDLGLRLSVHGSGRLNLAYDPRHELCRKIMRAQIELCAALGATRLVYHSGLQALEEVRTGVRETLLSDEELREGARREVAAFKDLAPHAADAGVVICMENLDPHLWEHTTVRGFGLPDSEIDHQLARLRVGPIVRQLEAVGHPNVAMTLDVGHLFLSSQDRGFPYLDAVTEAAPWVRHLHVTDNFGRLDTGWSVERERWAFGEADSHMPPGWGKIPFREVFARLAGYQGDLVLELLGEFEDFFAEARESTRALLG